DFALINSGLKKSVADGLLTTVHGEKFSVLAPHSPDYLVQYLNNGGVAEPVNSYLSTSGVKALLGGAEQLGADKVKVLVDNRQPLTTFTAPGPDNLLYELMSFFTDGSMSSGPLEAFLSARIAGVKYTVVNATDRSLIEARLGPDGLLYEIGGYDSQGRALNDKVSMELIHILLL